jgi:Basic region leucine zipper
LSPREAVYPIVAQERQSRHPSFGGILTPQTPIIDIGSPAQYRNSIHGRLSQFKDSNSALKFESLDSQPLYKTSKLVSDTTVSPILPLFASTHTESPMIMDGSLDMTLFNGAPATLNSASGTYYSPSHYSSSLSHPSSALVRRLPANAIPDAELANQLFDECVTGDFEEDPSFLYTPFTVAQTSSSTMSSGVDSPSISLQLDAFLNPSSIGTQDFNLFADSANANTDEWGQNPLFNPGLLAEDPVSTYALFANNATVTSAHPQEFSLLAHGDETSTMTNTNDTESELLPSPELSPSISRKPPTSIPRRSTTTAKPTPARRVSSTPSAFAPITPAPTNPSTPQPFVSRHTKRRLPIIGEDPAVVEKRRRNTVAAQRSRARKAEEKLQDKTVIARLEKENESLRLSMSYWKDRACGLGASPMEYGDN